MSHIGEFELIGRIAAACHPERSEESGVVGIGDDCAIIPQNSNFDTLVTTDLLIEGRHFLLEDITPFELGWKSAAVNISDIAAMGGRPTGAFLSIALPKRLVDKWIDEFIRGFNELCGKFGVALLGGDTSASDDKLFINVTVLGECLHGQAVMRSGARPGDLVCVSGFLGDSAGGLKLVLDRSSLGQQAPPATSILAAAPLRPREFEGYAPSTGSCCRVSGNAGEASAAPLRCGHEMPDQGLDEADLRFAHPSQARAWAPPVHVATGGHGLPHQAPDPADILIRRHYLPMPRVELGQQLAALTGVHAMMDISDGIASDLRHILEESSSRMRLVVLNDVPPTANSDVFAVSGTVGNTTNRTSDTLSAEIDLHSLPLSEELRAVCAERGWDAAELAVSGGEDYELLFTAAPGTELPEGCTVIGRIVPGDGGIHWIGSDKDFKGFTHF